MITLSASILGSQWSGLLSPIPVLAWPLCAFVHHQQGSDAARAVLRGILEGAYGVLIFYTIVAGGLGHLSPILVYAAAILASLLVSVPWLKSKLVLPASEACRLRAFSVLAFSAFPAFEIPTVPVYDWMMIIICATTATATTFKP